MAFRLFKTEFIYGTTYPNTQDGCLQLFTDFIDSFASDVHSEDSGWSYDTKHCPEKKPILLTPTVRTYAAFLVHKTGAKLMIAHSRYGVRDRNESQNYYDIGFIGEKTYINANDPSSDTSTNSKRKYFGLMSSFISAHSVNEGYDFNPSASIRSDDFYNSRMTKIITTGIATSSYNYINIIFNNSNTPNPCLSFTSGAVGEWFALCDNTKAAIGLGMKRKVDEPPCLYFIGDLSDNVSFSNFDSQIFRISDNLKNFGSNTPSSFYEGECNNDPYITGLFGVSKTGSSTLNAQIHLAFAYTISRTKAALPYGTNCVFDPSLFGYIPAASAITNQTFNNGGWITVSSSSYFSVEEAYKTSTLSVNTTGTLIISWDKAFNGNNVI